MDPALREAYQSIILDHDTNPRNYGDLPDATHTAQGYNPLCGDRYRIYVKVVDGIVAAVTFEGHGCAISRASASIMTTLVAGVSRTRVDTLAATSVTFLATGKSGDPESLGDLEALAGVYRIPTRRRCAMLAWTSLQEALASDSDGRSDNGDAQTA